MWRDDATLLDILTVPEMLGAMILAIFEVSFQVSHIEAPGSVVHFF